MGERTRTTCWRRGATGAGQGPNGSRRRRRRGPRGYREEKGFPWAFGRREASRGNRAPGHSPQLGSFTCVAESNLGPWSGRGSWDLVDRVSRPVSEVRMVLQMKISVTRLHLLSREENNQRSSVFCRVTQHFSILCLLVLHQVVGFSFYKPSNSPKASQLIKVRAGTLLY